MSDTMRQGITSAAQNPTQKTALADFTPQGPMAGQYFPTQIQGTTGKALPTDFTPQGPMNPSFQAPVAASGTQQAMGGGYTPPPSWFPQGPTTPVSTQSRGYGNDMVTPGMAVGRK